MRSQISVKEQIRFTYSYALMSLCKLKLINLGMEDASAWEIIEAIYFKNEGHFGIRDYSQVLSYCKRNIKRKYTDADRMV